MKIKKKSWFSGCLFELKYPNNNNNGDDDDDDELLSYQGLN